MTSRGRVPGVWFARVGVVQQRRQARGRVFQMQLAVHNELLTVIQERLMLHALEHVLLMSMEEEHYHTHTS